MKVVVTINLKQGVLDPEGQAIEHSLKSLGYDNINKIETGKQIIIDIDEDDEARARQKCAKMCETLLVNTVIEDYIITVDTDAENEGA